MKKITVWGALMTALFINGLPVYAADLISTAENDGIFRRFITAVQNAGLADSLKQTGPYTFFAPTNEAIAKLPQDEWNSLEQDPEKLAIVLKAHLIPGKTLVAEMKPGPIRTLEGSEVRISSDNGKVAIDEANVIQSDLEADNGVIHAIDRVVLPDSLASTGK